MSARAIEHAALLWHTEYVHRMALNKRRLELEKEVWPRPGANGYWHPLYRTLENIKNQIVAAKKKERAGLKVLARACAEQRAHLERADVIDVEVRQLTAPSTTEEGMGPCTTTN